VEGVPSSARGAGGPCCGEPGSSPAGSCPLGLAFQDLEGLAIEPRHRQAGHCRQLAPSGLQALLALGVLRGFTASYSSSASRSRRRRCPSTWSAIASHRHHRGGLFSTTIALLCSCPCRHGPRTEQARRESVALVIRDLPHGRTGSPMGSEHAGWNKWKGQARGRVSRCQWA